MDGNGDCQAFFNVMICFHDPTDNQPFISMDGHQVAMANNFQPTQIGTLSTGSGCKKPTRQNLLEPPPRKKGTNVV